MFVKFSEVRNKTYCDVFLCYKKRWCAPLGALNFIYDLKSLKPIEFLFRPDFIYAWNRKWFSMKWFYIWFKFIIMGLNMPCAYIITK